LFLELAKGIADLLDVERFFGSLDWGMHSPYNVGMRMKNSNHKTVSK